MLRADNRSAALAQEALFQNGRVAQFWDGERALGRLVSRSLALSAPTAWDIYLLYTPGASWAQETLPAPDFWMHQLDERPDRLLDAVRLAAEVHKAIDLTHHSERYK